MSLENTSPSRWKWKKWGFQSIPFFTIIIGIIFIPKWEMHKAIYQIDAESAIIEMKYGMLYYEKLLTPDSSKCFAYNISPELHEAHQTGQSHLYVRCSENEILPISTLERKRQKFVWSVGKVEYRRGDYWVNLHPKASGEKLMIPITIDGKADETYITQHIEDALFQKLLPVAFREDSQGNKTSINKNINN